MIITRGFISNTIITRGYGKLFAKVYRELIQLISIITRQLRIMSVIK